MRIMSVIAFFLCLVMGGAPAMAQYNGDSQFMPVTADGIRHVVSPAGWEANGRGNHRAIVVVKQAGVKAVRLYLPWRRPDTAPEQKRVVVLHAGTGKELHNIYVKYITNEAGSLAFEPDSLPGTYEIYYLPYTFRKTADDARYGAPWNDYLQPVYQTDQAWLSWVTTHFKALPAATLLRFEARKKTDFFTSMGLIATKAEEATRSAGAGAYRVFPEDRAFPIRLTDRLPQRWAASIPAAVFRGEAMANEYYTFQLGLWAMKQSLAQVRVSFSDLTGAGGLIAKDSFTCFNQEGTGWNGKPVSFNVAVPQGKVQALWIGLSVPAKVQAGVYEGWVTVTAAKLPAQKIKLRITINSRQLADRGDDDLWRHARLRWLNSTLGTGDAPVAPYQPLQRTGHRINASGKQLVLDQYGLPAQITTPQMTDTTAGLLPAPVALEATTATGVISFVPGALSFTDTAGKISWQTTWTAQQMQVICRGAMTFDGSVLYTCTFKALQQVDFADLRLRVRFREREVPYFMGIGLAGGNMPALPYTWNWKGPWDSFWAGSTEAGVHVEFEGQYNGPLLNDYKPEPPAAWANKGNGNVTLNGNGAREVLLAAATGACSLQPHQPLTLGFKLLITPVKGINTAKHFSERYYQGNPLAVAKAAADGANVINVHHNTQINPYINYPFIVRDSLAAYINQQHAGNRKVKLYYTIRELSNYATEIYALKSLGQEIFPLGAGKGAPWLWEHLNTGYKAAWYAPFSDETADASIVMNGFSRWINYYIEGLRWLLVHDQIDGLYLDDVAYDREVMARLRRVLLQYNPEALIDLHSNTNYSVGPANQYTAFFPYLDRLWFGESFKYNEMTPDQWLVQFSGIPFGLMSEMLQNDGNKWLGMVYGATNRHSWGTESPAAIWQYWDAFGIKEARMYGYWDAHCPVTSNNSQVKITVYERKDKWLLAIGNFSNTAQELLPVFRPGAATAGMNNVTMQAPAIAGFQPFTVFKHGDFITVPPKQGWLIEIVKSKN